MKKKTAIKTAMFIVLAAGGFLAAAFTFDFFAGEPVAPGIVTAGEATKVLEPEGTTEAEVRNIREWYEAVGTIRPRTEVEIEAQVMAQVIEVKVKPGDRVEKGGLLLVLDDRQPNSKLDQAKESLKSAISNKNQARQSVASAEAAFAQAEADYRRFQTYYESQAATERQLEQARSAFLQAEAGLKMAKEALNGADAGIEQARQVVGESEIALGYTRLLSPESGEVLKRLAEPGDLALPGKTLLVLQTTGGLRLECHVREGLIGHVSIGDSLPVEIMALDERIDSTVEEIVPYADPQTRTFMVKAALENKPGLFPGMFGKLLIPVREHSAVLVPLKAIRKVGQLEMVAVKTKDGWQSRYIKTGKAIDEKVEVLSGLSGNETIALGSSNNDR